MAVQLARRDSRGWVEDSFDCAEEESGEGFVLVVGVVKREERRVSWRPGAEGAPRSRLVC